MAILSLPVRAYPEGFEYDVDLEGVTYHLVYAWNARGEAWTLEIQTPAGEVLLAGLPLVVDFPLLQTYRSRVALPPGELLVVDLKGLGANPGAEDWGTRHALLYYETTEAQALALLASIQGG